MDTALMAAAIDGFEQRLGAVGATEWNAATPCDDWDVRTLVNHVVGELLWMPPLLEGKTIAEVGDRFDGDVLGSDPSTTYRSAAAAAQAAAFEPGAQERTVHLSFGDFPGSEYVGQVVSDVIIHIVGPRASDRRRRSTRPGSRRVRRSSSSALRSRPGVAPEPSDRLSRSVPTPAPRMDSSPRPAGRRLGLRRANRPLQGSRTTSDQRADHIAWVSILDERGTRVAMILVGVVLLILGLVLAIPILWTIGIVLVLIGAVLWILGATGRAVGGRNHYW